jgi:hypothetical protein
MKVDVKSLKLMSDYRETICSLSSILVPEMGLEPTRPFGHCLLRAAHLPNYTTPAKLVAREDDLHFSREPTDWLVRKPRVLTHALTSIL